jgi:hypothetical protein
LFLKEGAADIAAWGGGEFELLVETVNPIPAKALEFQDYEERVTEEEVPQKQARGQVNYHSRAWPYLPQTIAFVIGPGTGRER